MKKNEIKSNKKVVQETKKTIEYGTREEMVEDVLLFCKDNIEKKELNFDNYMDYVITCLENHSDKFMSLGKLETHNWLSRYLYNKTSKISSKFESQFEEDKENMFVPIEDVYYTYNDSRELQMAIEESLSTLTEREQRLVHMYYYEGMTLTEIAEECEVGPSCIKDALSKAIRKMRHPSRSVRLRDYLY